MRSYDKDFKMNAINLYGSSGRSIHTLARELGIPSATFSKWVRDYRQGGHDSFPGKGQVKSSEEELRALRKELPHVRQERDILKKAVAIFSGPREKGTVS